MLKQRVVTAIVLTLLIFWAVFGLSEKGFQLFVTVFWLVGSWEWAGLSGYKNILHKCLYTCLMCAAMATAYFSPQLQPFVLGLSLLFWMLAFYLVLVYPRKSDLWSVRWVMTICGVLVLLPAWVALVQLRNHENFVFLFSVMFFLVTAADVGAYFSGRAFGKNKLAVEVSPNKTWEGFWGGLALSCLISVLFGTYLFMHGVLHNVAQFIPVLLGTTFVAMFSVVGDLLESMCKRKAGIKDSGKILPGHGGILDRIDSVTAAAPAFVALVLVLESFVL